MDGIRITPSRVLFAILFTLMGVGVLAYLQLSFKQADVKSAIGLVESAKVSGVNLNDRMKFYFPETRRLCQATTLSEFYGHMEVTCRDIQEPGHEFRWRVNLSDGMVRPENLAAERLGRGEEPWSKNK